MPENDKMDYEAEPIENIFVSFDEENKLFYVEINEEYGFTLTPNQFLEFINKSIVVTNAVIQDNFNASMKSFLSATHKSASRRIVDGDGLRAIEEVERLLKENDNGAIAA